MSTTHAAWGKIIVARQEGKRIPPDWALDAEGRPTTDPNQAVASPPPAPTRATPEILCAHLAGVPFGPHVTKMYGELDKPRNLGHFMLALDLARFTNPTTFASQIDLLLQEIRSQPPSDTSRPPLAPGDPERLTSERRTRDGIPLGSITLTNLNALASTLGVPRL